MGLPPTTEAGLRPIEESAGGFTVRLADLVVEPSLAVILPVVTASTGTVVTVKVAVVAPAGTVTFAGTVAAGLALESVNSTPPAGAATAKLTRPVDETPPTTLAGGRGIEAKSGGNGRVADPVGPREDAE